MTVNTRMAVFCGLLFTAGIALLLCFISPKPMGITNPAALYCEELGYEYVVESTPGGERGLCQLPNGNSVDAWQFLKGEVDQEYSYCRKNGYEIKTIQDTGKSARFGIDKCAICVLKDGTEVEVTELMGLEFSSPGSFRVPVKQIVIAIAVTTVILVVVILLLKRKRAQR